MTQQWKLVPVEPTDEMETAAENDYEQRGETFPDWKAKYRAMLAAAPTPPASAQDDAKDDETQAILRWIMRAVEAAKEDCGMDPETPAAIRNGKLASIASAAAQALGLKGGPSYSAPAAGDAREWQGLTDAERDGYVAELVDYGTDFVAPLYSVVESIEKRLREKNAASQQQEG